LNAHSSIKAIPEIPISIFFAAKYKNINKRNSTLEKQTAVYLSYIQKIRPLALVDLHADQLFTDKTQNYDYESFLKHVFAEFEIAKKIGAADQYVDKNPFYTFHYKKLKKLSKDPSFIIIVRDYRANVLSRKSKPLNKPGNIIYNAFRWRFFFKEINKLSGNNDCLIIRYEDLVVNETAEISKICDFLSLPFESSMLANRMVTNISETVAEEKTKRFVDEHFAGLSKPMHSSKIEAWKNQLSTTEIEQCDCICSSYGEKFGYLPASSNKRIYFILVMKHLPWYMRALYDVYKEQIIYHLPIKLKLWRLKKKMG
jgi:hypothetical protein